VSTISYLRLADHLNMETDSKKESHAFGKKASPEKAEAKRQQMKYEGRRNMCSRCFVALSRTGGCNCE
jgi:hypothetical protein